MGLLIRVYKITELPLYGDELTLAYDSYSILKTGHDQTGQAYPLTFRMGAGRPGGYIYASLPFVALFGPQELGIRSLSILSGLGIILLMYFLGKKIFSERIGLIAAGLAVISPWDIYLSRAGFEAHFALFLALLGLVAWLYAKSNQKLYIVWALSWGLTILTYPTYKLTLPLIFILMVLYQRKFKETLSQKFFLFGSVVLLLFIFVTASQTFSGGSEERFFSINIFADKTLEESITQKINFERSVTTLPEAFRPIFYNKYIEYGRTLFEKHLASISNQFLFLRGDGNPRHNPGEMGMLYLVELPLLFYALIQFGTKNRRVLFLTFGWILIVPLATMFLSDPYHGLRNSFMIPPLILVSAFAISKLNKKLIYVVSIALAIQLVYLLQVTYFVAPNKFASFWSRAAREATVLAESKLNDYDKIYISDKIDNIEYAYPVYTSLDPVVVQAQFELYPKVFDKVSIVNTDKLKAEHGKVLVIEPEELDSRNLIPGVMYHDLPQ